MDKETQYYIDKGLLKINKEESLNEGYKVIEDDSYNELLVFDDFYFLKQWLESNEGFFRACLVQFYGRWYIVLSDESIHVWIEDTIKKEFNTDSNGRLLIWANQEFTDENIDYYDVEIPIYKFKKFIIGDIDDCLDSISESNELGKPIKVWEFEQSSNKLEESLNESKQDTLNFKNWLNTIVSDKYPEMRQDNREAYVKNWVDAFEDARKSAKSPENDYYYWIKKNSLDDFAKFINQHTIKQNQKQKAKEEARQVYSDNNWKVYEITSYEASKKYGASTKWCITGSKRWTNDGNGEQFWNDYFTERGIKFYFFINKDGHKYALAVYPDNKYCEIYNDADVQIAYIPDAPQIDEIKVKYTLREERQRIYNAITSHNISDDLLAELIMGVTLEQDFSIDHVIFCKNCEQFKDELDYLIPDDFIEFEAVNEDKISKEEYKKLTGEEFNYPEEYNDYYGRNSYTWTGDYPMLNNYRDIQDEIQAVSKEEFLNSDFWNKWEYYIFTFGEENYLYCTKNYNELLLELLPYVFGTRYWDADTFEDFFMDIEDGGSLTNPCVVMMTNTLINLIIKGKINNWQSLLKSWGCSDEYIKQLENAQKGDYYD